MKTASGQVNNENSHMRSHSNARSRHDEKENNTVQHAAAKGASAKQGGIVSTYTNLEPKRIIGSGSFGKCPVHFVARVAFHDKGSNNGQKFLVLQLYLLN